ncbi:hypothetical protein EWM64_g6423 [Hericium alpestre]|uniref:Uncharacterized protein n=1 Tax=Hericium alpestre TaxID=135208 RepID=A0A4Y9ZU58_9AGAM|nr:hypothetical protein EWM64_g6423 [Hericium alpestre]
MSFTLSRKASLHLPIQRPPLSECALDVHICIVSCNLNSPDAPSSWLILCPPAHPICVDSTIRLHLPSGQAFPILASMEYVRSLDQHAVEFAISLPVMGASSQEPRRARAYLSVLREWALLPQVLSSLHHLLYDFLPGSLPHLIDGHIPDPITPWTSCIHIRRQKCNIPPNSPEAHQQRREEYFKNYVFLFGCLPPPPRPFPPRPLRVSLPIRPPLATCPTCPKRAVSQVAHPMHDMHPTKDAILARPAPTTYCTF